MYGLIGRHIGGSFSARWFGERGVDYRNFELASIDELPQMLAENPSLRGFNVTSPYKESVIPFLDALSPTATEVGAVNCVSIEKGRLIGHNTDAPALLSVIAMPPGAPRNLKQSSFVQMGLDCFVPSALAMTSSSALLLGSGGAARAAAWALEKLGMEYTVVSRNPHTNTGMRRRVISYTDLTPEIIAANRLIINASPVGMLSCPGKPDIPYHALKPENLLFDMIYNPAETAFLREGRLRGTRTLNGLPMLVRQAELSKEIWRVE